MSHSSLYKRLPSSVAARGFTLIEVMIALIVTSIGMLGIAKVQALAYASTGTASVRSLVAMEAAGLASAMRANRAYWATGTAPLSFTITGVGAGTVMTISDGVLNGAAVSSTFGNNYCAQGSGNTPCTAATLAASDLHSWAAALNTLVPNASPVVTIGCTATIPVNCTIKIHWVEKAVAVNSTAAAGGPMLPPDYFLYVEP